MPATFELVRNANVLVKPIKLSNNRQGAMIDVDGKYQHEFDPKSRVSKHLELMTPEELGARLSGGAFFFVNGQLTDFRDGAYCQRGFIHDDKTIEVFASILGFMEKTEGQFGRRGRRDDNEIKSHFEMRKVWNNHDIVVPGYSEGGEFNSRLSFTWNPFVKTVNSAFELVRLICENGAIGLTSWLNTKIPLFNRWEQHLDIAARQIQNRVDATVIDRVQQMAIERGSVADCLLLAQHCFDRMYSNSDQSTAERDSLMKMMSVVNPRTHLEKFYKAELFDDKNLAAQVPGHLTNFDLYNIATEVRTHTNGCSKSTANSLDRFANRLMFDDDRDFTVSSIGSGSLSPFSNPETAFFSQLQIH